MTHEVSAGAPTSGGERSTRRIRNEMGERVARCAAEGPAAIDSRLAELDLEWDVGRALAAGVATAAMAGSGLAATVGRQFLALPAAAGALLLLHALGVRSPAEAVLRRMGYRTAAEIEEERSVLKALRGDFHDLLRLSTAEDRAEVARWEGEGGIVGGDGAEAAHERADRHAVADALRAARE